MSFSDELAWRGLIKDRTFSSSKWLDQPKTFYHGVDGSSNSLTVGNLAALILAKRFSQAGWKAVLLLGGATTMVGDPGGKAVERDLKPKEEVAKNIVAIKAQIEKLFAGDDVVFVNNLDWFKSIRFLDFLREVGKHYSMTELTQRDYIADRMGEGGSGISYAEFSYTLIQGFDFLHLNQNYGVELQIGGSDQWGNMLSGVPLVKKVENKEVHVMTMPLVVDKSTGIKFGKSEKGAVWLDPAKTTPAEFYQFWVNTDDGDVEEYLAVFTFLDHEQIRETMKKHSSAPEKRLAQIVLAREVTDLVHGKKQRIEAEIAAKFLTVQVPLADATEEELTKLKKGIPFFQAAVNGSIIEALVVTSLAASNTDARRLLQSGAVYLNGKGVSRETFVSKDFSGGRLLLRRGKAFKDSALVELK